MNQAFAPSPDTEVGCVFDVSILSCMLASLLAICSKTICRFLYHSADYISLPLGSLGPLWNL